MDIEPGQDQQLQHFLVEHQQLRDRLGRVSKLLGERKRCAEEADEEMGALQTMLGEHFKEEESDGLFSQILTQAPQLAHRIDALRSDHEQLDRALAQIQDGLRQELANCGRQATDFTAFSKRLMDHETRESEILQAAYDEDIGSQD